MRDKDHNLIWEAYNTGEHGNYVEVATDKGMVLMTPEEAEKFHEDKKKRQVNENIPLVSQQQLDLHKQLKPLIYAVTTNRDAGVRDDDAVSVHVNDLLKQGVSHENIKHVLSKYYSEEEIARFLNPQR